MLHREPAVVAVAHVGVHAEPQLVDVERQRFILIGRSDGKALRWPEPTHARGGAVDLLGARLPWRAAADIIDWTIPGRSIFGRARPLRPNTIRRIHAGAVRYGWPQPHIDALQALLDGREPVLDVPAEEAEPLLLQLRGTSPEHVAASARGVDQPLGTITASGQHFGIVMATALASFQAVAVALTQQFQVPPENLVTQGYGEQYLKVQTDGPSLENRRVAVRRITPLIDQQANR